ncbi:MAG: hypothetical protein JWP35_2702 [Caulobacter sp.]|nr:hypothetical protein [Caulobacter sp.]
MIVMIAAAVLGAALGVFVRPWLLAPALAVAVSGGVQGGLMLVGKLLAQDDGHETMAAAVSHVAGTGVSSLWPTLAAAGIAALLAALLSAMADKDKPAAEFWIPTEGDSGRARGKDGIRRRLPGMVEDREIHARAKGRIESILDL